MIEHCRILQNRSYILNQTEKSEPTLISFLSIPFSSQGVQEISSGLLFQTCDKELTKSKVFQDYPPVQQEQTQSLSQY